ncbi:MAG: pantetheine-phosphate adenylyltransferase [Alphaproteobacteria bacterium]|nr:pantetheine-phosphate adenylyltransferase [Alphaproteobacteria bacterium]
MNQVALYPGSFDPITNGHIDVIERSIRLVDRLVIAIGFSYGRTELFTVDERIEMIRKEMKSIFSCRSGKIKVTSFTGLAVEAAHEHGATIIIRGLRDATDFDYEMRMASMNSVMSDGTQTVFLLASPSVGFIASSLVRQIASMGGNVESFVPEGVAFRLTEKYTENSVN